MKVSHLFLIAALSLTGCASLRNTHYDAAKSCAVKTVSPNATFATWKQGQRPKRLIRADEGFCALTYVTGNFEGGGEFVHVYIGKDGYWYLGGQSGQQGVAAKCIIVRYAK